MVGSEATHHASHHTSKGVSERVSHQVLKRVRTTEKLPEDVEWIPEDEAWEGINFVIIIISRVLMSVVPPSMPLAPCPLLSLSQALLAILVIQPLLLLVSKHLVSLTHFLEFFGGFFLVVRILVRMPLKCELPVGLLDVRLGCCPLHSQDSV